MALIQRYADTLNGAITFTGNTLGYANLSTGTYSIGAYITTDTSQTAPGFPAGSTLNWTENKSAGKLRMTSDSEVVYAELIWGGSTNAGLLPDLDRAVSFSTPVRTGLVTPDSATAQNGSFYVRSANVTDWVKAGGAGFYQVGGVPSTLVAVGWTLAVVYKDSTLPSRNITFFVSNTLINNGAPQTINLTGFGTPASGPVNARLLVTAMQGDTTLVGDQLLFGQDSSSLQVLQGPNNPGNNFFATQINDDNGNLDTSGTGGNRNPVIGQNNGVVRYGWDLTNVDASSALSNGQNQAVTKFTSAGDTYLVSGVGVQIDVDSPKIQMDKSANKTAVKINEIVTYTVLIANTGLVEAQHAVWKDILPPELKFVTGSITVDGVPQPSAHPTTGVNLGTVGLESPIEVTFQAKVVNVPFDEIVKNQAKLEYVFESAPGLPIAEGTAISNETETKVIVRPPTPCEQNQVIIENSIQQEEQAISQLLATENGKIQSANIAFATGRITRTEQDQITQSANEVSQALRVLNQALQNKRQSIQNLCSGCESLL